METASRWMTTPAIVAPETMVLPAARQLLHDRRIRRLPVVNGAGALVGIVTEGDINRISASHVTDVRDYNLYHYAADLPLRDFMTRAVVTVTVDTLIVQVAALLREHRIGAVPVLDNGRLVGVISESDLFAFLIAQQHVPQELEISR